MCIIMGIMHFSLCYQHYYGYYVDITVLSIINVVTNNVNNNNVKLIMKKIDF